MFKKLVNFVGGNPHKKEIDRASLVVEQINGLEAEYEKLSADALRAKTEEFRTRMGESMESGRSLQEALDELVPEAFAAVREASKRTIGLRPYDIQLVGGLTLHSGKIAEMRTGEGKTLVATLPLYLNAVTGRGAHLVTVNDYLARRDARWMAPIFYHLGLTVGVLQMASRTENGQNAFVIDLEKESPHEDQHQLRLVHRREAYQADIVYGTNSEFGFDYLRDNLTNRLEDRVQRGHYYAIVDEVDNILIDEARTPLIISGPAQDDSEWYLRMSQVVRQLRPEDYEANEKDRSVSLTEVGEVHVEEVLGLQMRDPERPEDITPEQARMMGYLEQALRAQFLYRRNKDYLVQAGKVVIIDEFTGRLMPGRRWSDGLHQAVEAKEGAKVEAENVTYATITIQNYFRMYAKLAGMSGTAETEAEEFYKIYKLDVLPIPTNLEYNAIRANSPYQAVDAKDPAGYKFTYYTRRDDPARTPVFWKRKDFPDVVYRSEEAKLRAITMEILNYHIMGRPQLVGTTSVEHSERLSNRLDADQLRRLAQAQILRDIYLEQNKIDMVERAIPELAPLNKPVDQLETNEMRQLARSLNITMSFNPEDPENVSRLMGLLEASAGSEQRLTRALQGGVPHQVLNARKHDEESKIIARAGSFGAVTIATNMAGRGVDIKLGGDLDEEILGDANRVLERAGYDAYNMTNIERRAALLKLSTEDYGIYEEQVRAFLQYMDEMDKVRELGGLHVIGSERHEARRIDNQLRGRSARQGDPGSSRFYLALEDDLMRLFGGQQVTGLLDRLNIDESVPIESGIVGRLVEQSQERVEGSNFDVRKHLLEYDDVLNAQRKRIYDQRDRVFTKDDLSEDVEEMLSIELNRRIAQELSNDEGPWRLLAYLEDVQPPIAWADRRYPSFTMRLLIDEIEKRKPAQGASSAHLRSTLLDLAAADFNGERDHVLKSFNELLDKTEETLQQQRAERAEAIDNFFETLEDRTGEDSQPVRPQELADELVVLARLPNFRLTNEQMRWITSSPDQLKDSVNAQIEVYILNLNATRMVGALERRLGESLNLKPGQLNGKDWPEISDLLSSEAEALLARQFERLLGPSGQIARELDTALEKYDEYVTEPNQLLDLLGMMSTGTRMVFDRKTHRQGFQQTSRLRWVYLAAQLLGEANPQAVTADVLEHLEGAQEALRDIFGAVDAQILQQTRVSLGQTDPRLRPYLVDALGEEVFEQAANLPFEELDPGAREIVESVLGWWRQNEIYRSLVLNAISDLWVDYLTRVEALRVSIGLEAYAQRDPLVQYKSKASEMFTDLLAEIRAAVISRIFNMRPRQAGSAPASGSGAPASLSAPAAPALPGPGNGSAAQPGAPSAAGSAKKKRRRH